MSTFSSTRFSEATASNVLVSFNIVIRRFRRRFSFLRRLVDIVFLASIADMLISQSFLLISRPFVRPLHRRRARRPLVVLFIASREDK